MQRQWRSDDTDQWTYGFGDGSDGSSYSIPANEGCSGSSGGTALTLAAAGSFANDDLVLIHQTRGTGAGNWELNKISSGAGTTSLTMAHNLQNTYTDSGASQAQIITLHQYKDLTISTTVTAPAWDGSKGGIIAFFDKGECLISGTLNASLKGFRGGGAATSTSSQRGEGSAGDRATQPYNTATNNGSGGAGSAWASAPYQGGGGGGGHANAGGNGNAARGANGGSSVGTAELTNFQMGGAGGGGEGDGLGDSTGGNGGGIVFIACKSLTITGNIACDGGSCIGQVTFPGGRGAGGACLLKVVSADIGTNKITVAQGASGTSSSVGRIHIDYSDSYTGTTTPTIDAVNDITIVEPSAGGGAALLFYFM